MAASGQMRCDPWCVARRSRPSWHEQPGHLVVHRAFQIAAAAGARCGPVHLLAALAERDDEIGNALRQLRAPEPPPTPRGRGTSSTYIFGQLQRAAVEFAAQRGEPLDAPHLLVAALDQADPETLRLLTASEIDPSDVRRTALSELGVSSDLAPIAMPAPTPAGTMDRPPLAVQDLDPRAWTVLAWRQDHLPLHRIRRTWHADALHALEQHVAWQLAVVTREVVDGAPA